MKPDTTNYTPIDYAKEACDNIIRRFTPNELPPAERFHYHQGVSLAGMQKTWKLTGEQKYFDYIKAWVDKHIDEKGVVHNSNTYELDDIQPGILLYDIYEKTGDERYKIALDDLIARLKKMPRTPEGGFEHKPAPGNQLWLDSLYMGGPILATYGKVFNDPLCFEIVVFNAILMEARTRDPKTGLLYHAYDVLRERPWADPVTGCSPEFWCRAIGWVPVAIYEDLDYMPELFFGVDEMKRIASDLLHALVPFQDEKTGLWYEVVNRGDDPANWLETSSTCLYAAAIAKGIVRGWLDPALRPVAEKAYEGVISRLQWDENGIVVNGVCIGTGVGDYQWYIDRPTTQNDLHGMGAFLHMCVAMEELRKM